MPGKHKWYNVGGQVTTSKLTSKGAARPAIDAYLAGTNPMSADYSGKITRHIPQQHVYADLYTPPAVVTNDDSGDTDVVDTTYTGAVDDAGVPAPYLGVDEYDTEGDDNFLTEEETAAYEQTIADQFDSIDTFDSTKTAEEQLSDEDYASWSQTDATADNYLSLSNPAVAAADTIYNNNQQIYGEETGNNVTSLVTGNVTGLDETGIEELQSADDDATWAGDSSPVSQLINDQTSNYQDQVTSGAVPAFDINDQSTWVVPSTEEPTIIDKVSDGVSNVVDSAAGLVSGGGDDGVGNFGAVGDVLGGIGDALGITDYAGEAKAAEEAAAAKAAEEAAAAEAAAEAQRQADAEVARQVAEREAAAAAEAERKRQAAAEAERKRQAAAAEAERQRIAAEEEAARIAAEEAAAAESNITEDGEVNWDSQQTVNAQELLAAGEIDFVEYLNQIGYYNAANKNIDLGFQIGVGSPGSAGHSQAAATDTGYVAADGPVHTKTGEHTVENEMDGATAVDNWKKANQSNDDPHMSHDEIIAHHEALNKAETDLIQSDLSDDDFWEAYDDDDGGGGGSSNDTSTVICTALMEMGELDPTIWKYDLMYGEQYVSATTYRGYHDWAIPMVPKVKARHWLYFPLAKVMAKAWAYQMAHFMSNGEHGSSSLLGKAICWFGEGYCTWRGKRIEAREEGGNYAKS